MTMTESALKKKDPCDKNDKYYDYDVKCCKKKDPCDKDDKYSCCCDTTKLRELLRIFSRNNTPVIVFTETKSIDPGILFVFVKSIVEDMVYFSTGSTNGPVRYIIPISDISFIIAATPTTFASVTAIIDRIANNCDVKKDPCCQREGIGNTLNSIGTADLLLPLSSGLYTITTTGLISGFVWTTARMQFLFLLGGTVLRAADDDLLVIYTTADDASAYIIVPTCKIDTIVLPTPTTIASNIYDNTTSPELDLETAFFSSLDEDIEAKVRKLISIN